MLKSIMENGTDRESALKILNNFIDNKLHNYANKRNIDYGPGNHENISLLSPYIRNRIITEQEVINSVIEKFPLSRVEKFIQEIFWRTYWKGWLELRPKVWADYKISINMLPFLRSEYKAYHTGTSHSYNAAITSP